MKGIEFNKKPVIGRVEVSNKKADKLVLLEVDALLFSAPMKEESRSFLKKVVNSSGCPIGVSVSTLEEFFFLCDIKLDFVFLNSSRDGVFPQEISFIRKSQPGIKVITSLQCPHPALISKTLSPKSIAKRMKESDAFFLETSCFTDIKKVKGAVPKPILVGDKKLPYLSDGAVIFCGGGTTEDIFNQIKGKI